MSDSLSLPSTPVLSPIRGHPEIPSFRELSRNDPPSPPRAPPPSPSRRAHFSFRELSRSDPPSPPHAPPPSPTRRPEFSAAVFELNKSLMQLSHGGQYDMEIDINMFGGELRQGYSTRSPAKRARSSGDHEDDAFGSKKLRNKMFDEEQSECAFAFDGFDQMLDWSYMSKFGSHR